MAALPFAFDVQQSEIHEVGVTTLDGLHQCDLILLHANKQRYLVRGTWLVVQQKRCQSWPVPPVCCRRDLGVTDPRSAPEFLDNRVADVLI